MPEQSPTLRDMIQEALDNGVTYKQLGQRAIDPETGKTASQSVFFDTVSGKLNRMPYEHHLRAVAVALRIPYEEVRRGAIAQWLPGTAPEIAAAPVDLREWASWSDDDRDLVLLAVRTANARVRRESGPHRNGNAA